jgi:hypothetical protein
MVQERHYAAGDPRIAIAKIVATLSPTNLYPQPSRGETQERQGEPMIDVWTIFFPDREAAGQYVNSFNEDVAAAIALQRKAAV